MIVPQSKMQLPTFKSLEGKNHIVKDGAVDWSKETYHNNWDGDLDFECPEGQYIARVRSKYDGDPKWKGIKLEFKGI